MNELRLSEEQINNIIDTALAEDISHGDVTSEVLIPTELQGKASLLVQGTGVLAGGEVVRRVFLKVDPSLRVELLIKDGTRVKPGDMVATVSGRVMSILKAERVALNFLQRLSGIATLTAQYVEAVKGLPTVIVDTRKTTPGLRLLEKYAVRVGGGQNHRYHLGDGILIKDNHLAALRHAGVSLAEAISRARQRAPYVQKVEVEVGSVGQAREAAVAGADIIMLDNMSLEEMRQAVAEIKGRALTEASGGITLDNVRTVAEAGVDFISIGALTHSAQALDMSLELEIGRASLA